MLIKLSIRNIKRSMSDFLIYFMTLTMGVCLFYTFNAIVSKQVIKEVPLRMQAMLYDLNQYLMILSLFISVILGFLCLYGNQFLIKRRKREFGLYRMLGMAKSKISMVLMLETAFVGVASLIVGLILGAFLSQVMAAFTLYLFDWDMQNYQFIFSTFAVFKTIGYFSTIFLMVMMFNVVLISRCTILELLTDYKKSKERNSTDKKQIGYLFWGSIFLLIIAYILILKINLSGSFVMLYAAIALAVLATWLFYFSTGSFILEGIKKNKKRYYQSTNMFVFRQLDSKLNMNAVSMTLISVLLFLTLSMLSLSFSYKEAVENDLYVVTPYDASIVIYGLENENHIGEVESDLVRLGVTLKHYSDYEKYIRYTIGDKGGEWLAPYAEGIIKKDIDEGFPLNLLAIKESDYKKQMALQGISPQNIKEGETIIITNMNTAIQTIRNFTQDEKVLKIGDQRLRLPQGAYQVVGIETESEGRVAGCFVIPDDTDTATFKKELIYNIQYKKDIKRFNHQLREVFKKFLILEAQGTQRYNLRVMTKEMAREQVMERGAIFVYLELYMGFIFLITSGVVLALQQLGAATESIASYRTLRGMGVSERQISEAIFRQVLMCFMTPLLLAVPHTLLALYFSYNTLVYIEGMSFISMCLVSSLIFFIVYGAYFLATYTGYKRIVQ